MSRTFSIACHDCKQHLWIAQSSAGKGHIYIDELRKKALYIFLMAHRGHTLVFDNNCEGVIVDYNEIEPEKLVHQQ